jgi:hypothetical protein
MKTIRLMIFALAVAAGSMAQQWEVGGGAGVSFLPGVSVTSSAGSATAGFQTGIAAGAFLGQNISRHLGGEVRYAFMQSNLRLESGGTTATFSGQSHVVGYDLLWKTNRGEAPAQFFVAAGGGMKIIRGTGKEAAYQPLSQFGYFTKTQTIKPMVDFGAGILYRLGPRLALRMEFRDYLTVFPEEIIAPAPGAKFGNLLHDFVPMVSISYQY